jgi:hypothetical protein
MRLQKIERPCCNATWIVSVEGFSAVKQPKQTHAGQPKIGYVTSAEDRMGSHDIAG